MVQAKALRGADGELLPRRLLPDVIGWLTSRCAAVVRVVAAVERRRAFVEERLPIWKYVWAWAHGHMHAEVIRGNQRQSAHQDASPWAHGHTRTLGEAAGGGGSGSGGGGGGGGGGGSGGGGGGGGRADEGCDPHLRPPLLAARLRSGPECDCERLRSGPDSKLGSPSTELLAARLRSGPESSRLRAAYEIAASHASSTLGESAAHAALIAALTDETTSTSLRRTAMYGALAAQAVTPEALLELFTRKGAGAGAGAGTGAGAEAEAEAKAEAQGRARTEMETEAIRGNQRPSEAQGRARTEMETEAQQAAMRDGGWMAASLIRALDGFDAELLLSAHHSSSEARYVALLACVRGRQVG
jgi:hypothetical protein